MLRHLRFVLLVLVMQAIACSASATDKTADTSITCYLGQKPPGQKPELFAPGVVSTSQYDITPTFSPTLDEVFFGRRPTEQGSDNSIYHTRLIEGNWSEPSPASFSSGASEFETQFSCDGKTVYYNRGRELWMSERTDEGWSGGKQLEQPLSTGMCIAVAANRAIYFTDARDRQYGIWCSKYDAGRYEDPILIIPMAAHPTVPADESFIIFDKYGDNGSSALYVSFHDDEGRWSEPVDLGEDINATGTELIAKLSPDGNYLFFQRKVDGNTDIYWVTTDFIDSLRSMAP